MMEDIFLKTIHTYGLIRKKEKLILGVSGGPDSVCMLHLFDRLRKDLKLEFICAHLNHSLRPESDDDEAFVKKECRKLKVPCIARKKDVKKLFAGDSLEQTARHARFDFFLNCARASKIKKLALAHNRDDLAETVLINIIRGTGLRGLRGIIPLARYKGISVIRPLLDIQKRDILRWLDENGIPYVIDKSNLEDVFLRNRIRHSLMNQLKAYNPNIVSALTNLARISGYDYDYLQSCVRKEYERAKKGGGHRQVRLDIAALKKMPRAALLGVIRMAVEEVKGTIRRLDFKHIEEVFDLIFARSKGSIVHLVDVEVKREDAALSIKSLIL